MSDTSPAIMNIYIRRPVVFIGHRTGGQVPEIVVQPRPSFYASASTFETVDCVLKTTEYVSFNSVPRVRLALNNRISKPGFKQSLEIARGVLAPGKYQIDTDFPTFARVRITGAVEIVGESHNGSPIRVALDFYVESGGKLTTTGVYGFSGLSLNKGEASIGISNPAPKLGLKQALLFKGDHGRTSLQPGEYQVDAPVDISGTKWTIEDGDVTMVGSPGGAGSFKGTSFDASSGKFAANSVAFGGNTGQIVVNATAGYVGSAVFRKCSFGNVLGGSPMLSTGCSPSCGNSELLASGNRATIDVYESVFHDLFQSSPVYVRGQATVTLTNCVIRDFGEPLTAYAGGLPSHGNNNGNNKLVIKGGSISNYFGDRGALFANYGHISVTGVQFKNNVPRDCLINGDATKGKITGMSGC